jgi:hypothetical protein
MRVILFVIHFSETADEYRSADRIIKEEPEMKLNPKYKVTNLNGRPFGDGDYRESRYLVDKFWYMGDIEGICQVLVGVKERRETVVVPDCVRALSAIDTERGAFEEDTTVRRIVLLDSVRRIGRHAFRDCVNLEEVVIPDSVEQIDSWAFAGCAKLKRIVIPEGVKKIDDHTFYGCSGLEEVVIPASVTHIGEDAFAMDGKNEALREGGWPTETKLTSIVIPDSVLTIGKGAFRGNLSLERVVLSKALKEIPDACFCDCPGIKKMDIPQSVTRIAAQAFAMINCVGWCDGLLEELRLPDSLKVIEHDAFDGCENLPRDVLDRIRALAPDA